MINPAIEIQRAIYQRLSQSAPLIAELGGNRIYDEAPPAAKPPYILFAKTLASDWSTDSEAGAHHQLTLEIWSARNGRKQVLILDQLVREALADLEGDTAHHHIIRFAWTQSETDVLVREDRFRCRATYEAVSEPLA